MYNHHSIREESMNIRNILFLAGLSAILAGCVIHTRPYPPREYAYPYDVEYYDYRDSPSYEGYYYVRIVFISGIPDYVDDDRYVRPIPPHLREHFRRYRYDRLGRPPIFSRDREVRDGYPLSRIIYLDGVPYVVGDDRLAQPLPERLRSHFRYTPDHRGDAPAGNNGQQPSGQHDNGRNNEPFDHDRRNNRNRDRKEPQQFDHGQRDGGNSPDIQDRTPRNQPSMLLRQLQRNPGNSSPDTQDSGGRDHDRAQTGGDTGQNKADKQGNHNGQKDNGKNGKQGDNARKGDHDQKDNGADDNSGNDRGRNFRHGDDADQQGSERSNGNR